MSQSEVTECVKSHQRSADSRAEEVQTSTGIILTFKLAGASWNGFQWPAAWKPHITKMDGVESSTPTLDSGAVETCSVE